MSITAKDVIAAAFQEINVARPTDLDPADATYGLAKLNRILDNWNAEQRAVYGSQIETFTIPTTGNPITIGLATNTPTPQLTVTVNRPESIDQANILVGSGASQYRYALKIVDRQWWLSQSLPNVTSSIPRWLYYEPLWPNGNLYLYYVESSAYTLELLYRVALAQLTMNSDFSLPPGYLDALTLTLAESLLAPYHVTNPDDVRKVETAARMARARVFSANEQSLSLSCADPGLSQGHNLSGFDWRSGTIVGQR